MQRMQSININTKNSIKNSIRVNVSVIKLDTFWYEKTDGSRLSERGIRVYSRTAGPVAFLLRQDVLELDTAFREVITKGWKRFHVEVPGLRLVQLPPGPLAFAHRWLRLAHYLRRGSRGHFNDILVLHERDENIWNVRMH